MTTAVAAKINERNWVVGLISAGHFFSHFVMLAVPPLYYGMKVDLGISNLAFGGIVSIMATTTAVGQIPMGFLVDRIGGRLVLLLGIGLMSVSLIAVVAFSSYWALFIIFALAGLGNSVFHPADFAILATRLDDNIHGRAFSIHSFMGYLGWAGAALIMIPLAGLVGWRLAIVCVGLAGIIILILMIIQASHLDDRTVLQEKIKDQHQRKRGLRAGIDLIISMPMVMMFLFYAMSATATSGIMSFSIPANVSLHGIEKNVASFALTAHLVAGAVGVLVGGWLADFTNRHNLVASISIVMMGVFVILLAFDLASFFVIVAMILAGVFYGISAPSRDILIKKASPTGGAGVAFGFTSSGMSVGNVTGPLICGWIMDGGRPETIFTLLAAILLVSVVTVVLTRPR